MAGSKTGRKRPRGNVEKLKNRNLRLRVNAGTDPVTKRPHYLRDTVPAGPEAEREADKVLTRLLNQVDERRNPRTSAMVARLGIHTTLHKLRHYSATELISLGVDVRTVAGRLGQAPVA